MEKSKAQAQPSAKKPVVAKPVKNKMNKKNLYFICGGALVVIAIIVAVILIVNKGGSNLTCTIEKSMFGVSADVETKLSFNKNNYGAIMENKISVDMGDKASDSLYESVVKSISYSYYLSNKDNITNSMNMGHTTFGDDTKIERNGSKIVISSVEQDGEGEEVTQEEIDALVKSMESSGYTCNR